jgi:hypothetical protein
MVRVTDRLDDLLAAAGPLLRRVDDVLTAGGAPPEHAVWQELRRVRLLPAAATEAVAALRPSALREAVTELRAGAQACVETADALPPPGDDWTGEAAEAYDELRTRAAAHLSGGDESLDERLEATADLAQALTDWMTQTRAGLASALATVLTSRSTCCARSPTITPRAPTCSTARPTWPRWFRCDGVDPIEMDAAPHPSSTPNTAPRPPAPPAGVTT